MKLAFLGQKFAGASVAVKTAVVATGIVALEVGVITAIKVVNDSPLPAEGVEVKVNYPYASTKQSLPVVTPGQDSPVPEAEVIDITDTDKRADETLSDDDSMQDSKIDSAKGTMKPSKVLVPERLRNLSEISPP